MYLYLILIDSQFSKMKNDVVMLIYCNFNPLTQFYPYIEIYLNYQNFYEIKFEFEYIHIYIYIFYELILTVYYLDDSYIIRDLDSTNRINHLKTMTTCACLFK